MKIFILFLAKIELARRASIENMYIKTYIEICKFTEISKVSSLDPQIITTSEDTAHELNIWESSVGYPEEHVFDQLNTIMSRKVNESRQFGTTAVRHCDNNRSCDEKKLKTMLLLTLTIVRASENRT